MMVVVVRLESKTTLYVMLLEKTCSYLIALVKIVFKQPLRSNKYI